MQHFLNDVATIFSGPTTQVSATHCVTVDADAKVVAYYIMEPETLNSVAALAA